MSLPVDMRFEVEDMVHDIKLAHEVDAPDEYLNSLVMGRVVIRVGGVEYEGRLGRIIVGTYEGLHGLRFLSLPITIDDHFHIRN